MDYHKELKKKLSASYEQRVRQWLASDPAQLLEAAEEIAAARFIHENLVDSVCGEDASFLRTLDDPLEDMSSKWVAENGSEAVHDEEIRHCIWSLQDAQASEKANEQGPSTVGAFLAAHPGDTFHMMTPGGYVDLSPELAAELLAGKSVSGHPGCAGCDQEVTAEELLPQIIARCNRQDGAWYLISDHPHLEQCGPELGVTLC